MRFAVTAGIIALFLAPLARAVEPTERPTHHGASAERLSVGPPSVALLNESSVLQPAKDTAISKTALRDAPFFGHMTGPPSVSSLVKKPPT